MAFKVSVNIDVDTYNGFLNYLSLKIHDDNFVRIVKINFRNWNEKNNMDNKDFPLENEAKILVLCNC